MRYARFAVEDRVSWGRIEEEASGPTVLELEADPFADPRPSGRRMPLEQVRLLAPFAAATLVGFGTNYEDEERPSELEQLDPFMFVKPPTAVVGPDEPIVLPRGFDRIVHEAELAVVIGKTCRDLSAEDAERAIFGYTCANDLSGIGLKSAAGIPQVVMGKSFDSFCPLGPWIETELDTADLALRCRVNGELRQDGTTAGLRRGIAELIAMTTRVMTLHPGDTMLTGTPPGFSPLQPGDQVEVEVAGIGVLSNPVVSAP